MTLIASCPPRVKSNSPADAGVCEGITYSDMVEAAVLVPE